ncbi:PREDICTED: uncharacterized protein LOC109487361 isoform X2 [Branchiostoma belcheri]|uniref:Uncharacterized protein LOC109487361 isoform X2 n=1 Tax=Branchiostoma belcheri TaxID=7741 RepID=A0A6P5AXW4_BRABE|nr:PREDICTED: uncharacterized protein LOC109487361 isoform X2 [Branchiostoma belcheri]
MLLGLPPDISHCNMRYKYVCGFATLLCLLMGLTASQEQSEEQQCADMPNLVSVEYEIHGNVQVHRRAGQPTGAGRVGEKHPPRNSGRCGAGTARTGPSNETLVRAHGKPDVPDFQSDVQKPERHQQVGIRQIQNNVLKS